jgi:ribose transport system ATP-binding protein
MHLRILRLLHNAGRRLVSNTLLEIHNVSKRFPGVVALDNVSMNLIKGEVHAIAGENGAGKSTLMKILSGVHSQDEGNIIYKGSPLSIKNPHDALVQGISIIYQELTLAPHLTVAQNVFLGREHLHFGGLLDEAKQNNVVAKMFKSLHLDIPPTALVKDLGVSKQQMVEIVKALSTNSEVLIMDEPTSALTETEIDELFKVIHKLKKEGVGIFYISHRLEELRHVVDRISVLRDGKHIGTYDYEKITINDLISKMVGRSIDDKFPQRKNSRGEKFFEAKKINRKGVLKDISFDLYKGEILGIAGLMGAGRTELARAIFGADKIDSGEMMLDGKAFVAKSPSDAINAGIGYITEDRKKDGLALTLQVDHNITLADMNKVCGKTGIISSAKERLLAMSFIKNLNIKTPSLFQIVKKLSGGNQQKVVLAKWLCRDSKLLIFDEPTRGIDVGAKYEVYELMNELVRMGAGIIMISSELPEIIGMSDRIIVLHEGEVSGELSRKEATQEKILNYATGLNK